MGVLVKGVNMASDTRSRMIEAAIGLLQRHGLAAMSFTDVLADSGAARGAIYHHFPGGKEQLAAEAAGLHGRDVRGYLAQLPGDTPQSMVAAFISNVRPVVEASAAGGGCAVAAVTVDGGAGTRDDARLRDVADEAFAGWAAEIGTKLIEGGMRPEQAADLASLMIITLEGAHVVCRAAGSIAPFDSAARALTAAVAGVLLPSGTADPIPAR
jgi:TetR/AcrR family transcriptional repressor of lmrAB and yxaGH operons